MTIKKEEFEAELKNLIRKYGFEMTYALIEINGKTYEVEGIK